MESPPRKHPPEQPSGSEEHTMAVPLLAGEDEVVRYLDGTAGVTIAAVNSPRLVVLAGSREDLGQAERRLSAAGRASLRAAAAWPRPRRARRPRTCGPRAAT